LAALLEVLGLKAADLFFEGQPGLSSGPRCHAASIARLAPRTAIGGWATRRPASSAAAASRSPLATTRNWGCVVLAKDEHFQFRAIEVVCSLPSRDRARIELQLKMAELLGQPQRIFPQDS